MIITSFLHSGKVSKTDIAKKLETTWWSVDRVHTSKCAGMASYEREFIEYGEDNLELNDFVDDALQVDEDESEYNQYIFDDSFGVVGTDVIQQIEEDLERDDSDSISFENIESPRLNDLAVRDNRLKRNFNNESMTSSLDSASIPGSLHS